MLFVIVYPSPNSKKGKKLIDSWLIRYADDFIVTSPCNDRLIYNCSPSVNSFLFKRGLNVSEKKSRILNLEKEGFIFLGWDISLKNRNLKKNKFKSNKKVFIIKPSKSSIINALKGNKR